MTRSSQRQLSPQASESNTPIPPVSQKHPHSNGTAVQASSTMQEIENNERPVREKLKNTSITNNPRDPRSPPASNSDTIMAGDVEGVQKENSSLKKKRSFEDVEEADSSQDTSTHPEKHVRKRSRSREPEKSGEASSKDDTSQADAPTKPTTANGAKQTQMARSERFGTPTEEANANVRDDRDNLASPKNKRSREEFLQDHSDDDAQSTTENGKQKTASDTSGGNLVEDNGTPSGEPKSKRHRDSSSPHPEDTETETTTKTSTTATKVPTSSGFADTSAASPFSGLSSPKSPTEQPQTSASAFSKSGFSSFANSSSSLFGGAGAKNAEGSESPFAAAASDKPALSTFGSANPSASSAAATTESKGFGSAGSSSKSPFATAGTSKLSGFSSGASGFGGLGGGLSSFASKPGSSTFGSTKPASGLGAPTEDDEEGEAEDGEEGDEVTTASEADKQDERFHVQDVNTGEDDESTHFQSRAKLYAFMATEGANEKTWKERGLGTVKLNVSMLDEEKPEEPQKVRLIMRADGSQRVLLNTPVLKDIKFGDAKGDKPTGQTILFRGTIDEKPELELLQLKMKPVNAVELWQQIMELQEEM